MKTRALEKTITPVEPIALAAKKILRAQFSKWRTFVKAIKRDGDADAIHDLRVAVRRIRLVLLLTENYSSSNSIKRLYKSLRKFARALGRVRDSDVLLESLNQYRAELTSPQRGALNPLRSRCQQQRQSAERRLIKFFQSGDYHELVKRMEDFLKEGPLAETPRVGDVAPGLIWVAYGTVRGYENLLDDPALDTLHALRVECKRLRYTFEFFSPLLGARTNASIEPLIALQTTLGEWHDADVASQLAMKFVAAQLPAETNSRKRIVAREIGAYVKSLRTRMRKLKSTFAGQWHVIMQNTYRRNLAAACAAL